jgi:hypothetical protein
MESSSLSFIKNSAEKPDFRDERGATRAMS